MRRLIVTISLFAIGVLALSSAAQAVLSWSSGSGTVTGDLDGGTAHLYKTDTITFEPAGVEANSPFDLTITQTEDSVSAGGCTIGGEISDETFPQTNWKLFRVTAGGSTSYEFPRPPEQSLATVGTRRQVVTLICSGATHTARTEHTLLLTAPGGVPAGCYQTTGFNPQLVNNWSGSVATLTVGDVDCAQSQVVYTGPSSVQYSDAATLSGHLQTSTATALPGYGLGFTLGTQSTSGSPTDASGNVSAPPLTVTQAAGAPGVKVDFSGDAANNLNPATTTAAFTIAKEDCTLAYTGDTIVNAANTTTLKAQFGELDSSPGDWSGKSITFTVTDAAQNVQTFTATTNASGVASTSAALGPNVYGVVVSFATDAYYLACASATDTLVIVQDAAAKITGGGWISQGTGNTNFGFNVIRDVTGLKGQLQVRVRSGKDRFHSTSVLTLDSSGNSGTWTGTGKWNGVAGYSFTVSVVDNGTSGKKGDTISILIKSPTNVTVFTTSGPTPLKGGNIVVH